MSKIIFGNLGQFGDIVMNTVVARSLREKFPNAELTMGIGDKYKEIEPLFRHHKIINNTHIYNSYDNWPTKEDIQYLQNNNFDLILHGMPQHPQNHCWYRLISYQTQASCIMNGLVPPNDLQCYLNKWFKVTDEFKNCIAIAPFTKWKKKNISINKWEQIRDYILSKKLGILQLGGIGIGEPLINGCFNPNLSYFDSVKSMLSCRFLITLDGGMNWVSSAYNHPTLGLMGFHYDGIKSSKLYQPINYNGYYLESQNAEDIPNELIFHKIDEMIDKYY